MSNPKPKRARLTLNFEDGSTKEIVLAQAIEINTPGLQSLAFNQTRKGDWVMAFTKSLFEGKRMRDLSVEKIP